MPKLHKSLKQFAYKKGLFLGVILILFLVFAYFVNWDFLLEYGFEVAKLPIILIFGVWAAVSARKKHRGTFSFRDGFSLFFITVAIGLTLSVLVKWLFYNYIDLDFGQYINEMGIEKRKEQLELAQTDAKELKEEIAALKASYQLSFKMLLQEFVFRLVVYCIPAILVGLILKTKKPLIR